ncbi:hypothetical protein SAMN02910418_02176 [Bowdeniella nasicola]|uniref:DUF6457 domain-containing protein n=1 Tax=Bowdeniella nasicola TaxID=208480 RepID=A0A1H4D8Q4_9ACTO|nr:MULTISPECIES: DUF6457 domain-containing protein [Bowdeniella]SEA68789.1 hypothetical protein SAMN02910418_02176 [Bowdeniella nasicola]
MAKMSEEEKMAVMHAWLDDVCTTLDLDRAVLDHVTPQMLDLIRIVAHGPSRPGAPMTALLVGLDAGIRYGRAEADATGEGGAADPNLALAALIRDDIDAVTALVSAQEHDA